MDNPYPPPHDPATTWQRLDYIRLFQQYPVVTRQMIADWYGISRDTSRRRLYKKQLLMGSQLLLPKDVKEVFKTLGVPGALHEFILL